LDNQEYIVSLEANRCGVIPCLFQNFIQTSRKIRPVLKL